MELKFNNVWGGPVSLETMSCVFLVGVILLASWILLRKATNPRVSGLGPLLLLASLAWYGITTVMIARLGIQAGEEPMERNIAFARGLLVGWWVASGTTAYIISRRIKESPPKPAA